MKYRKGYKYQLAEDYQIMTAILDRDIGSEFLYLKPNGLLIIKSGYSWDGASGPAMDTKTIMRGSLVHDALYQLLRQGHLVPDWRAYADDLLKRICLEDGMCSLRAWYVHRGVSSHAGFAADPKYIKKIHEAP